MNAKRNQNVHNDFKTLDEHIKALDECKENILSTTKDMEESIITLNEQGFQDGNFEKLYKVFEENKDKINDISNIIEVFRSYVEELSELIKSYNNIEL